MRFLICRHRNKAKDSYCVMLKSFSNLETGTTQSNIIGVSFRCACRSISKDKVIDSGINKAPRVVKTTEN